VAIRRDVLRKPGPLTADELAEIRIVLRRRRASRRRADALFNGAPE
jgi:hypothetical protein